MCRQYRELWSVKWILRRFLRCFTTTVYKWELLQSICMSRNPHQFLVKTVKKENARNMLIFELILCKSKKNPHSVSLVCKSWSVQQSQTGFDKLTSFSCRPCTFVVLWPSIYTNILLIKIAWYKPLACLQWGLETKQITWPFIKDKRRAISNQRWKWNTYT